MLKLFQDWKGKLPVRLIRNAKMKDTYFDSQFRFLYMERDKIDPGKERMRELNTM